MNFENYEDLCFTRKLLSFLVKELREDPIMPFDSESNHDTI